MPKDYISSIKLPNGRVYYLRGADSNIRYLGVTTTALTDGSTTNPIAINGQLVTAESGDIVLYEPPGQQGHYTLEFIYSVIDIEGTPTGIWQEFGQINSQNLGAFAYVDEGYVTIPSHSHGATFNGTEATIEVTLTPSGTVSAEFTGESGMISVSGTPLGSITVASSSEGNYQPSGTISHTLSLSTSFGSTINAVSSIGKLPTFSINLSDSSGTRGLLNASIDVSNSEQLNLFYDSVAVSFYAGELPTTSSISIITDVSISGDVTFTGTSVDIDFSGSSTTFSGTYTPSGSITAEFSGSEVSASTSYTPSGTVTISPAGGSTYTTYPGSPNP